MYRLETRNVFHFSLTLLINKMAHGTITMHTCVISEPQVSQIFSEDMVNDVTYCRVFRGLCDC
jgi:hypothetical protein